VVTKKDIIVIFFFKRTYLFQRNNAKKGAKKPNKFCEASQLEKFLKFGLKTPIWQSWESLFVTAF